MDTFVAIDTETTGLSFTDDRIIQFGCNIFHRGRRVFRTSFYIASMDVPNSAFHVNGISSDMISSGKDPEWAFCLISALMHKTPRTVLAYNAPFDLLMLANEFRRHGIVYDYGRLCIIDPLVIYRHYHPFQPGRLVNACSKYQIPYEDTHSADDDSEAAGHLFIAQQRWHGLYRLTRPDLEYKQRLWAKAWASSYEEWAIRKGRSVSINEWPYSEDMRCFLEGEQSLLF